MVAPGDEVVVPTHLFLRRRVAGAGAVGVRIPSAADWAWDVEAMAAAVTARTRALVVCNPTNPSGYAPSQETVVAVLELAARNGLTIVSDESYARYFHDNTRYHPLGGLPDLHPDVVPMTSLSNNYAFTSSRIGYIRVPARLLERVRALSSGMQSTWATSHRQRRRRQCGDRTSGSRDRCRFTPASGTSCWRASPLQAFRPVAPQRAASCWPT